jgi:hypothetical protein
VPTVNQTTHWLLGQRLPTEIGSYRVERRVVSGPSYADYAGHHLSLGHGVLFRHEHWSADLAMRDALEGLRRARRLQAEIQHPHILPVFDFFEHRGEWFSVFPRVADARALSEIIASIAKDQRPPFTIAEFVAVSAGVTAGLAAIHRAGFVHRTLGIHNVLVDPRDHVLLTDLGCATPVGADDAAAAAFRQFMRPVALVLRFRRSRGRQRQQLKWIAYAAGLAGSSQLAGIVFFAWTGRAPAIVAALVIIGLTAIPVAAGVAILRHRLYDIDRLINRTLVYGLLTLLLAATYAAGVFVLGGLLNPAGGDSALAVAASTPVEAFSARLRDQIGLETVADDLVAAVEQVMEPTGVSLWIRHRPG